MKILFNKTKLQSSAINPIGKVGDIKVVSGFDWLIGIKMPKGQTVALYPISRINLDAPPAFYIVDCVGESVGVHNKAPVPVVVKALRKNCDDPALHESVKILKRAIMSIST